MTEEDQVQKPLVLSLSEVEMQELCRVLVDEDQAGALTFLQRHVRGKLRELMEGG